MDWKFGTQVAADGSHLRTSLEGERDRYCSSAFYVDPLRDDPTMSKARELTGQRSDQSGEHAFKPLQEEARVQMATAIDAAVGAAEGMRAELPLVLVSLYGRVSEEQDRPDEVTIVINRFRSPPVAPVVEEKLVEIDGAMGTTNPVPGRA